MKENYSKYGIVGAGLSGLTAAYHLLEKGETDIVILESRDRCGGRIMTENGIDFGATWFQNYHTSVLKILNDLKIGKFHQYATGRSVMVYSTLAPEHYFENDATAPAAYRIAGGSAALIHALAETVVGKVKTDTSVSAIEESVNVLSIKTDKGIFNCEKVIVTVPPRIATQISFSPELPRQLSKTMKNTHTWMSNAMKVGLTFKKPFWRNEHLSGMIVGQVGAVTEIYDHCDMKNERFALMGFINEGLRDMDAASRKRRILEYLSKYLGDETMQYLTYDEKDWSQDRNTSCETIKSIYMSPSYGDPAFAKMYMNDRLLFSGAETSPVYGGYMAGAILSGISAAEKVM